MSCRSPFGLQRRFVDGPLLAAIDAVSGGTIDTCAIVPVTTAKVVCANYRAIMHDFPQVFSPGARQRNPVPGSCPSCERHQRLCPEAINAWLVRNAAWISAAQVADNPVNTPISTGSETRTGYRPPEYGRAMVVPVDIPPDGPGAGLLDLKGCGVAAGKLPSQALYANGLEYLGYALADFFYGWLLDDLFARTVPGYATVPVYAVIDLGFDVLNGWHGTGPAGLHVRRAHRRRHETEGLPYSGSDQERVMLHMELLLRNFGVTTAGPGTAYHLGDADDPDQLYYNGKKLTVQTELERAKAARIVHAIRSAAAERLEVVNVQLTDAPDWANKTAQLYDFGQVNVRRRFVNPLTNPVINGVYQAGRIVEVADPSFVQPDARYGLDPDLCGRHSANAYGFFAAQGFRSMGASFGQGAVEALLRIARAKAMGRDYRRMQRPQ